MTTHINRFPFSRHALALALALAISPAYSATMKVGGSCTLANAINNANTDMDTDGAGGCPAGSGADTLNLAALQTYKLINVDNQDSTGPNGLPLITSTITINGNNATIKRSNAAGTAAFRLLRVTNSGVLTLKDVALTGGSLTGVSQYGAGIRNDGSLSMKNGKIFGNNALGGGDVGGGIASMYRSSLALNNSTISGNSAPSTGGIANFPAATATINGSTISDNSTTNGGVAGIANGGTMNLVNSTVSRNHGKIAWATGGIINSGKLLLRHATVARNSVELGNVAGVSNVGKMTLIDSIIADSQNGGDCYTNSHYGGVTVFQGQTLIGDGTCHATLRGNPRLNVLLDNGGHTLTHALQADSPAINAANSFCLSVDQRGDGRPQPICDIGAFENLTSVPVPVNVSNLVSFFDGQASLGGIQGLAPAPQKLAAIRNQLLTAGEYQLANSKLEACGQLSRTLTYLDGNNAPSNADYVTGSQVNSFIGQINALRTSWSCP